MAKEWLNHYLDMEGEWTRGQREYMKTSKSVDMGDSSLRIYETSRSGAVVLSPVGEKLTSYGDAEVYLKIFYTNGSWDYLSAPLHTAIELSSVKELELNILFLVGNVACARILYRAMVNAHCVYEKIITDAESNVTTGTTGSQHPGQSFNETRAVDVTVLTSTDRVTENLKLKGLNLGGANSALVGARIYDSDTQARIASSNVTVAGGSNDVTVTIPISTTLVSGKSYRIGFYVETNPLWQANGNLFLPDPFSDLLNPIPYVEDTGVFRINSAHAIGGDFFPANPNLATPQMTIRTRLP